MISSVDAPCELGTHQQLGFRPRDGRRKCPYRPEIERHIERVPTRIVERIGALARGTHPWPAVFTGKPGTGKTCTSLLILDAMLPAARLCYVLYPELCEKVGMAKGGRLLDGTRPVHAPELYRRWKSAHVAVLDEVGVRDRPTETQYEVLYKCLEYRPAQPTVIVTNLKLGELTALYDDRIGSRLAGGTVIDFGEEDLRLEDWTGPVEPVEEGLPF